MKNVWYYSLSPPTDGAILSVNDIDVNETLAKAKNILEKNKTLPAEVIALVELLVLLVSLLVGKLSVNSSNSSIPPSKDPLKNKGKGTKRTGVKRKAGAQKGHKGATLEQVDNPDVIETLTIDKRSLPKGEYTSAGFDIRQTFDVKISTFVTEYRAEVLEDQYGNQFVAEFPDGVQSHTQYGGSVKAQSVYMSVWQLIPLLRVSQFFTSQFGMGVSKGSIANFNKAAFKGLESFDEWAKVQLIGASLNHADETGINIGGKNHWLHSISNSNVALFHADEKRGREAMERMGILENFGGKLVHDHWKPYYSFDLTHCLCNAHHLRELTWAHEVDGQKWAEKLIKILLQMNEATQKSKGVLTKDVFKKYRAKYLRILKAGDIECPLAQKVEGRRGRTKQSKSRNLLDRLQSFEEDVLRFATDKEVPFTNNAGENDIRMTKVQQKISGCFRSKSGAEIFCRIRSFLLTCQKQGYNPFTCLEDLFRGKLPDFME
jgi:transposase